MSNIFDFNNPPPNHTFSASIERVETKGERGVRLFKDVMFFIVAITFVGLIAWLCTNTLLSPTTAADEKKWAMSVLSAAAGGIIGYLIRK